MHTAVQISGLCALSKGVGRAIRFAAIWIDDEKMQRTPDGDDAKPLLVQGPYDIG